MKNQNNKTPKKLKVSAIQLHLEQCEKRDKLRDEIEQINSKIAALLQLRAEMISNLAG